MSELHIYSRVSSAVQEEDGTSLDTQKDAGERLAKQLGFSPVLWNEGGQSSASEDLTNRPVLRKLLERVNDGLVQHVFVYNTDRLSRNEATWSVIRLRFVKAKVTLHTPGGVFNLSNPMDKMLLGIMSEISTYDNALRSERTLLGKNERVKQGFWLGGPPPFGYRLESKKLIEEPKESKWVKFIFESYKDKWTTRAIRQELMKNGVLTRRGNVAWSLGSIEKLLTNTHYGGYHIVKLSRTDEQVRVQCPAILPSTLIRQVKVESTLRSRQTRVSESNLKQFYLLRGFLFCASCGARLSGRLFDKQNRSVYYCPRKERNYVTEDVSPVQQCSNRRYLKIDKTDELVWDTVVEVLSKSHKFKDEVKNQVFGSSTTHESTQDDLRTLKRTQSRLKKEILDETNSIISLETAKILKKRKSNEISKILENIDAHRLELEASLEKVNIEILRIESKTQWVDWLTKFGDRITELSDFSPQDKQSFLTGILEKIEVSTVNTQEHSLIFHFKVPYVNDKIAWTKGKSGKRKYRIDGGESVLSVEIDSSKKSPTLRA